MSAHAFIRAGACIWNPIWGIWDFRCCWLSVCRSRRVLAHATGTQRALTHKHPGGQGGGPRECVTATAAPQWQNGLSFSVHVSCLTSPVFPCPTWNKQEVILTSEHILSQRGGWQLWRWPAVSSWCIILPPYLSHTCTGYRLHGRQNRANIGRSPNYAEQRWI